MGSSWSWCRSFLQPKSRQVQAGAGKVQVQGGKSKSRPSNQWWVRSGETLPSLVRSTRQERSTSTATPRMGGGLALGQVHSAECAADDGVQRACTVRGRGRLSRPRTCTVLRNQQAKQRSPVTAAAIVTCTASMTTERPRGSSARRGRTHEACRIAR